MPTHKIGSPKAKENVETIDHPDPDGNHVYYIEVTRDPPAGTDRFAAIQRVYGRVFKSAGDIPDPNPPNAAAQAAAQAAIQKFIDGRPGNGCRAGTVSQTAAGVWTYQFSDSDSIPSSLPIPNKADGTPNLKVDNFLQVWVKFAGVTTYTSADNGRLQFRPLPPTA
jgi:hypothetical protein